MSLQSCIISPEATIRQAVQCIDDNAAGIALIVSPDLTLIDVVTDGDIRRAVLQNVSLDAPLEALVQMKANSGFRKSPVVASATMEDHDILALMRRHHLRQIPVVDPTGRVLRLVLLDELVGELPNVTAVIMAGGFGRRLRPLTDEVPKPMLRIGGAPILERVVGQLRDAGVLRINISVHYKKEIIIDHFGDGSRFGVEITYLDEEAPLGTAGAIANVPLRDHTTLVMNGDVLTTVDFRAMLDFHRQHKAQLTMAVACYEINIPYGVVTLDDAHIGGLSEKPTARYFINTGIYMLEQEACNLIPPRQFYNMTDLVDRLLTEKRPVVGFPLREYWRDIGRLEDFEQANVDVMSFNQVGK